MLCQEKSDGWMESERKPFTQTSKERMKNKIRCAGQVLSRCATSRASSNPLRSFSLLGCRPIRIKRKDDSLVNKFPILSSFLFILTRLVAYPKYRSNNPLMLCRDELHLWPSHEQCHGLHPGWQPSRALQGRTCRR